MQEKIVARFKSYRFLILARDKLTQVRESSECYMDTRIQRYYIGPLGGKNFSQMQKNSVPFFRSNKNVIKLQAIFEFTGSLLQAVKQKGGCREENTSCNKL